MACAGKYGVGSLSLSDRPAVLSPQLCGQHTGQLSHSCIRPWPRLAWHGAVGALCVLHAWPWHAVELTWYVIELAGPAGWSSDTQYGLHTRDLGSNRVIGILVNPVVEVLAAGSWLLVRPPAHDGHGGVRDGGHALCLLHTTKGMA